MTDISDAGTITLGGRPVPRFGFGTMRLTGPNIFGEPADRDECVAVVRAAYDGGVRVFDTAWYYGPDVASPIVKDALFPYAEDVVFVSKLGGARTDDAAWVPATSDAELRAGAERECRLLGVDHLPVVHLRWMGEGGPGLDDILATMTALVDEGTIGAIGLSSVSLEQLEHVVATGLTVASLSNAYGPGNRADDALLDRCEELGIPFLPFFSLVSAPQTAALDTVAQEIGATPSQVALAWQLQRSPVVLPIPGTSKTAHLRENLAAAAISLSPAQVAAISG